MEVRVEGRPWGTLNSLCLWELVWNASACQKGTRLNTLLASWLEGPRCSCYSSWLQHSGHSSGMPVPAQHTEKRFEKDTAPLKRTAPDFVCQETVLSLCWHAVTCAVFCRFPPTSASVLWVSWAYLLVKEGKFLNDLCSSKKLSVRFCYNVSWSLISADHLHILFPLCLYRGKACLKVPNSKYIALLNTWISSCLFPHTIPLYSCVFSPYILFLSFMPKGI